MIPRRELPAYDAFVAASSDRLLRTAYLLSGDRGHAEDLVQTALMRTARRWSAARDRPEAYARQVVVNLAKDRWRERSRRPAEQPLELHVDQALAAPDLLDRDLLVRAARELPDGQRAVLVLRYFEDLSVDDTAACLGCSPGTVKSQTSRALESLRRALAPTQSPTLSKEPADADRR